jgi:hypothetical protein
MSENPYESPVLAEVVPTKKRLSQWSARPLVVIGTVVAILAIQTIFGIAFWLGGGTFTDS